MFPKERLRSVRPKQPWARWKAPPWRVPSPRAHYLMIGDTPHPVVKTGHLFRGYAHGRGGRSYVHVIRSDASKEVIHVPTKDQYVAAAKVPPSKRTPEQARLVAKGQNIQAVRNADYEAKRRDS